MLQRSEPSRALQSLAGRNENTRLMSLAAQAAAPVGRTSLFDVTGLDAAIARQVKDILAELIADGATVILTTHILEVAERMADRIGIIDRGRLIAEGTAAELATAVGGSASLEQTFLRLTHDAREAA